MDSEYKRFRSISIRSETIGAEEGGRKRKRERKRENGNERVINIYMMFIVISV